MIDLGHQRLEIRVFGRVIQIGELLDTLSLQRTPDSGKFAFAACPLSWGEGAEE